MKARCMRAFLFSMKSKTIITQYLPFPADLITPVAAFLKLRDQFPNTVLLESTDYHNREGSYSFIACSVAHSFKVINNEICINNGSESPQSRAIENPNEVISALDEFRNSFQYESIGEFKFPTNGLFGYTSYDAVQYFEQVNIEANNKDIPLIAYNAYHFVLVFNHFNHEMHIFQHSYDGNESTINLQQLVELISGPVKVNNEFALLGEESSDFSDQEFLDSIAIAKQHCKRGNVFQLVLSRSFQQRFSGDEFNVYRSLRAINPSPYLFYFDYGHYKLFGSSPEAQLVIQNNEVSIHPIAGTFRRTGKDKQDAELAQKLLNDPKENAEHVMLVDLARNDLSRNCNQVKVAVYKEVQFYSHVIHLVSKVTGQLKSKASQIQIMADTFPAGTLSGAPKHKALNLINQIEKSKRGYYGGAIGLLGFNGEFNHAIMIRTFLSYNGALNYRAGAGIVNSSNDESELNEVYHKVAALKRALVKAQEN